jgi:hypothetical protein
MDKLKAFSLCDKVNSVKVLGTEDEPLFNEKLLYVTADSEQYADEIKLLT